MADIFQAEFEKVEELNESPQRIMAIQEAARRRISEYLHSHVQSKLLALQYYLSRCQELIQVDPEEASKLLERIRSDLQQVQDNDIRRASHELYPSVIRLGLIPALLSLRDRINSLVPIELVVSSQVSDLDGENGEGFNDEFKIGVYRIVEDALNNVVKHARATGAKVELHSGRDKSFSLRIEDNGFGFEISKISFGLGLMAMRDDAEALGGWLRGREFTGKRHNNPRHSTLYKIIQKVTLGTPA